MKSLIVELDDSGRRDINCEGFSCTNGCVITLKAFEVTGGSYSIDDALDILGLPDKYDEESICYTLANHFGLLKTPREKFMDKHNKNLETT